MDRSRCSISGDVHRVATAAKRTSGMRRAKATKTAMPLAGQGEMSVTYAWPPSNRSWRSGGGSKAPKSAGVATVHFCAGPAKRRT